MPSRTIRHHRKCDRAEEAAAELADFLETGSTPEGWVCEAAR